MCRVCGEAGDAVGSACAIEVRGPRRRPPSVPGKANRLTSLTQLLCSGFIGSYRDYVGLHMDCARFRADRRGFGR